MSSGLRRYCILHVLILDLSLLHDYVLEVLQFELQQVQDWGRWLGLAEVIQYLQQ